jgi:hypothetical protein
MFKDVMINTSVEQKKRRLLLGRRADRQRAHQRFANIYSRGRTGMISQSALPQSIQRGKPPHRNFAKGIMIAFSVSSLARKSPTDNLTYEKARSHSWLTFTYLKRR